MKRGEVAWDTLIPWMIALVAAVIVFFVYAILADKGGGALQYLKDLFRFGS
ncbi:hypothetical protein KW805_02695 [Candidatus Pacearchaeota archaeon]|nr:hypothetical protein [Candidatus Pacearchaeota archaeon]